MSYQIWLSDIQEMKKYYSLSRKYRSNGINQYSFFDDMNNVSGPLILPVNDESRFDFSLAEIDLMFSSMKDISRFCEFLKKNSVVDDEFEFSDKTLRIASCRGDKITTYVPIFNNNLLRKSAELAIQKRKEGIKRRDVYLNEFGDEIKEFSNHILNRLKYKDSREDLLSCDILPGSIKDILSAYYSNLCEEKSLKKKCGNNYRKKKNNRQRFEIIAGRKKKLSASLYYQCCKYDNLRSVMVWEQDYKQKKREEILDKDEAYRLMAEEQRLRWEPIVDPTVEYIYQTSVGESGEIDYDKMFNLFSADDIYAHEHEAQKMGLIPPTVSKTGKGKK